MLYTSRARKVSDGNGDGGDPYGGRRSTSLLVEVRLNRRRDLQPVLIFRPVIRVAEALPSVNCSPWTRANKAEFVAANTSHVIAAFLPCHQPLAVLAELVEGLPGIHSDPDHSAVD
jgi:hypothetical protein